MRYFATTQASGTRVVPMSTAWRRLNGRWRIHYSSALDTELRIAAQTRAQLTSKPGSPEIDPRALRAGDEPPLCKPSTSSGWASASLFPTTRMPTPPRKRYCPPPGAARVARGVNFELRDRLIRPARPLVRAFASMRNATANSAAPTMCGAKKLFWITE